MCSCPLRETCSNPRREEHKFGGDDNKKRVALRCPVLLCSAVKRLSSPADDILEWMKKQIINTSNTQNFLYIKRHDQQGKAAQQIPHTMKHHESVEVMNSATLTCYLNRVFL